MPLNHTSPCRILHLNAILLGAALSLVSIHATESWTDYRGPWGTGHVTHPESSTRVGLPLTWSETENVQWKTRIPLTGLSTPVVMDGQVWLTTATEDGHDLFVVCLDAESGQTLLYRRLFHSDDPEPLGNGRGNNSYATPSPVIEPGRVIVHYGSLGTACLDTETFDVLWKRNDMPCRHYRGAASSPVLFDDTVILTFDGADLQYQVALDTTTGRTVWRTERSVEWNDEHVDRPMVRDGDWRKAHSTPLIVHRDDEPRMYSVGAKAAYGYDPRDGKELWMVQFHNWSAAPRPLFHKGNVIFATGFSSGELWSVQSGGQGDVTDTHVDWTIKAPVPRYASPILVDDLIYIAAEESFLSCIEADTGKTVWTERVGGKFRASPIYADNRIYFFSQEGVGTVIEPGREFNLLAQNKLDLNNPGVETRRPPGFTACPAVAGKALYLRTRDWLYRVEATN